MSIARSCHMNSLIGTRVTRSPDTSVCKLKIRRSTHLKTHQEMKGMGVDIRYSNVWE